MLRALGKFEVGFRGALVVANLFESFCSLLILVGGLIVVLRPLENPSLQCILCLFKMIRGLF
jgi:hypothetical protein